MRRAVLIAFLLAARPSLADSLPPAAPPAVAAAPAAAPASELTPTVVALPTASPAGTAAVPISPTAEAARARRHRWFVLPAATYLPEAGFGGGATAGLHIPREGAPRPTSFFATALYTTEGMGLVDVAGDVTFASGAALMTRARAYSTPDRFYGIGPDAPSAAEERFTRRALELVASAELPLFGAAHLRAGPRLELRAEELDDLTPGGALDEGGITGAGGSAGAAAGLGISWDTREGIFWPQRGSMAQVWYVQAPAALSRTGAYGRGVVELRHFAPLGHGLVLGLHGYGEAVTGAAPFTILPRLGSTRILRGIREGRYRDRVGWALQSELRAPIWRRFSGVAFGAVGDVAPRIDAIRIDDPKLAGGVGLRYRLTDEGANARLDVAASRFGVQFYGLVLEAF